MYHLLIYYLFGTKYILALNENSRYGLRAAISKYIGQTTLWIQTVYKAQQEARHPFMVDDSDVRSRPDTACAAPSRRSCGPGDRRARSLDTTRTGLAPPE